MRGSVLQYQGPWSHKSILESATGRNARRFRRYDMKLSCRVKPRMTHHTPLFPEPEVEVQTRNISGGGLYFFAPAAGWKVGTPLEFDLEIPAPVVRTLVRVRCMGTVARVEPQEGGGVGIGATIEHYKLSPLSQAIPLSPDPGMILHAA